MILPPIPVANYVQFLIGGAVAAKFEAYRPSGIDSGGETWFDGNGIYLCEDAASWRQVWDTHIRNESIGNTTIRNLNPPPVVDFKKNVLVALFAGPTPSVLGYQVASSFKLGNEAVVRLVPVISNSNTAKVAIPRPWVFLVLKRSNVTVTVQTPNGKGWTTVTKVKPEPPDTF